MMQGDTVTKENRLPGHDNIHLNEDDLTDIAEAMQREGLKERLFPEGSLRKKIVKRCYHVLKTLPRLACECVRIGPVALVRFQNNRIKHNKRLSAMSDRQKCFETIRSCSRIDVLTSKFTIFIAKLIQKQLCELGIECQIHIDAPAFYQDIFYIVVCPQCFPKLPPVYAVFQMEQAISGRWYDDAYLLALKNASAIFEYSKVNMELDGKDEAIAAKQYYIPIDYLSDAGNAHGASEKEYDVLFYGDIRNERRRRIIDALQQRFQVKVVMEAFGDAMLDEIRKARILLNIHYYEDALLETTRIYETLSLDSCVVVSERSNDLCEEARLEDVVDFVDVGDVDAMVARIDYWLTHEAEREKKVQWTKEYLQNRPNAFQFYFQRFLLANDRMDLGQFYERNHAFACPQTDRICLSLPETFQRGKAFQQSNRYGFEMVPGLRHFDGRIGCAYSFQYYIRTAMEQGRKRFIICEDDVVFPEDFETRLKTVLEYLDTQNDWDVFSGLMSEFIDVGIQDMKEFNGETFVHVDKMISMVLNVYAERVYDTILNWKPQEMGDGFQNNIDQYLKKKVTKVITTDPFLVGHLENAWSAIFNQSNLEYTRMIRKASAALHGAVCNYASQNGVAH